MIESLQGGFPQFSRLPLELRDQIWGYALPEPRVYEVIDSPSSSTPQSTPASRLMFADVRNEPPPAIARVCHDARQAVLRRYKPLVFSGTVKHIDLSRDIILLDSYLQVKRLLKVIRLLSQIEVLRKSIYRLALGTSWGLYTGLHLRMFHKTVQTKRNMTKFLEHLSKFRRLKTLILVVYQRSAFNLKLRWPSEHQSLSWRHYDLWQPYHYNFNVNFNFDNYFLRRPHQSMLVKYESEVVDKTNITCPQVAPRQPKQQPQDPQPCGHQVHELKDTFERWMLKLEKEGCIGEYQPPALETATLTWIYAGVSNASFY
ncbi:uncharacterized protein BCR38DRAFT_412426 [Pseudomassariella vexata]|uniref:2EXR domain-containing protein n=1 Tax=Pseudomassariella vexata TaxID=1141098 RepID=A0A1Y2DM83_9PEZI|nr:uncharacterized protein BCR38DRAFT_412426 [Pseudomassariella vexata]ORY60246.1 hypothetical protein BCR38DRAFT_412426 [Pseudomassariella vexata]